MRYFGVLLSRREALGPSVLAHAANATKIARRRKDPVDDLEVWTSRSGRIAAFAWGNNPEVGLYGGVKIISSGPYALLGSGHYYDSAFESDQDFLQALVQASDPDRLIARLGGVFALCLCDGESDRIRVWNALAGCPNVLFREGADIIAVSTRGLWVSLVTELSSAPKYNIPAFGPFILTGSYPTEETLYRGVRYMSLHSVLLGTHSGVKQHALDDMAAHLGHGVLPASDAHLEEVTATFLESLRVLCNADPSPMVLLSGGKDSRVVAAAVARLQVPARFHFNANWSDHPDLIIAETIANILGGRTTRKELFDRYVRDDRISLDIDGFLTDLLRNTDGLYAFPMVIPGIYGAAPRARTQDVSISGAGGELLRGGYAMKDFSYTEGEACFEEKSLRAVVNRVLLSRSELLTPESRTRYHEWCDSWFSQEFSPDRPLAVLERLFLAVNQSRRAPYLAENEFVPFLDIRLLRLANQTRVAVRRDELYHFEIIRRLAPVLEEVPTASHRWGFEREGPRPGDEVGYNRRTYLPMPWGKRAGIYMSYATSTDLRSFFEDSLLREHREVLEEVVDLDAFRHLFRSRAAYDWSSITPIWMAHAAALVLSNQWLQPLSATDKSHRAVEVRLDVSWNYVAACLADAIDAACEAALAKVQDELLSNRFPSAETLDALSSRECTTSADKNMPLPRAGPSADSRVEPRPASCAVSEELEPPLPGTEVVCVQVTPLKGQMTWWAIPINSSSELGGRLVRLKFQVSSKPALAHAFYLRYRRPRPDKSHILYQGELRAGPSWNEQEVEFIVPPDTAGQSADGVELWIPLGTMPIDLKVFFTSTEITDLQCTDSETARLIRVMHGASKAFAKTLGKRLGYLMEQGYIDPSRLARYLDSFNLDRPGCPPAEATLRDVVEETDCWRRWQFAPMRHVGEETQSASRVKCIIKEPFVTVKELVHRQLHIHSS